MQQFKEQVEEGTTGGDVESSTEQEQPSSNMPEPDHQQFLGKRGIEQATYVMARWQMIACGAAILLLVLCVLIFTFSSTFVWVNGILTFFFLVSTIYRVMLIDKSLHSPQVIQVTTDELKKADEAAYEWPRYVVQVPLYKEPGAILHLKHHLGLLDYPKDRLVIQLLVEEDDEATRAAIAQENISAPFKTVLIPVSYPRTKPKACNVGLAEADGDFLVIFDAEDRPEPDQLKKAALAFSRCHPNVACIQAKLNFYNRTQNLITRLFAAEYSMWFDLSLPGLDALRAPIPLGGTSNHFRLSVLKDVQGWDEYNVTEDCDLGLRLFARGWRTRIMDSTTWEEACPRFFSWIRQRSRWVKGYIQTYLVHMRKPIEHTQALGLRSSLHFHLLIGGSVLCQLLAPFYWALVIIWLTWPSETLGQYFPGPVFIMGALCLFVGNFSFVYTCAIALACRGFGRLIKFTPLMILYWVVMSLAAWKGALQLIWSPHYWEKTDHHTS